MKKITLALFSVVITGASAFAQKVYTPKLVSTFLNDTIAIYDDNVSYNGRYYWASLNHIWVSDGTQAGSKKLYTFNTDPGKIPSAAAICEMNGRLYMAAAEAGHGYELWVTDGTANGTHMVKEINPGPGDGIKYGMYVNSMPLVVMNNNLYFYGDDGVNGTELWQSDGTDAGTKMVKDINTAPNAGIVEVFNSPRPRYSLLPVSGKLFFSADDGVTGPALWVTDGTSTGTNLVMDFRSTAPVSMTEPAGPRNFMAFNNQLVCIADDNAGPCLFISDGTPGGTQKLKDDVLSSSDFNDHAIVNNTLVFYGTNSVFSQLGLYATDGTPAGTKWLNNIVTYNAGGSKGLMAVYKNKIYFPGAATGTSNFELCVTDGTLSGTSVFKDLVPAIKPFPTPNPVASSPVELTLFGDKLYMRADDSAGASVIWQTDGTVAGTVAIKYPGTDINKISSVDMQAFRQSYLVPVGDKLFFWNTYKAADGSSLYYLGLFPDNIKETAKAEEGYLYPNPAGNYISLGRYSARDIVVYNSLGMVVLTAKITSNNTVNIETLVPGVYHTVINGNDGTQRKGSFQKL